MTCAGCIRGRRFLRAHPKNWWAKSRRYASIASLGSSALCAEESNTATQRAQSRNYSVGTSSLESKENNMEVNVFPKVWYRFQANRGWPRGTFWAWQDIGTLIVSNNQIEF